jgi:very-short-patch-repair endonuclease
MSQRQQWADFVDAHATKAAVAKAKSVSAKSKAEDAFAFQCRALKLDPMPETQYRFWPGRRFAFDYAWPAQKLALEIDGGVFMDGGGRHNRGSGYRQDCEKFAEAAILGWRVIRCLPEHVTSGHAMEWIRRALSAGDGAPVD